MNKVVLEQKGDDVQMTFPADTSRRLGLEAGQEVTLVDLPDGVKLVSAKLTPERRKQLVREVLQEQAEVLRLLADR